MSANPERIDAMSDLIPDDYANTLETLKQHVHAASRREFPGGSLRSALGRCRRRVGRLIVGKPSR